jgi:hypothetical protein
MSSLFSPSIHERTTQKAGVKKASNFPHWTPSKTSAFAGGSNNSSRQSLRQVVTRCHSFAAAFGLISEVMQFAGIRQATALHFSGIVSENPFFCFMFMEGEEISLAGVQIQKPGQ